jgi:hypothetical protein
MLNLGCGYSDATPPPDFSDGELAKSFSYSGKEDINPCILLNIYAYLT